jgi:hypothetical protein
MKLTALAVLFATTILLTGAIFASSSVQYADAIKGKGVSTASYGSSTNICGIQLCSDIPGGKEAWEAQKTPVDVVIPRYGLEQKGIPVPPEIVHEKTVQGETCQCGADGCNCPGCTCSEDGMCSCHGEPHKCSCGGAMMHGDTGMCQGCGMKSGYHGMKDHGMKTITGSIQSDTDPGLGHEQHQLAVLLAPSEKMYKGMLTTIWTPDGKTKFALTLVDQENKMGSWMFTGNALAVHTFNDKPFSMSYSVHYAQVSDGHGSCDCAEGCSCDQGGNCICSGEAGSCMCGPNCTCGEMKHGSQGTCPGCGMTGYHHGMQCNCSEDGTCSCGEGCTCSAENCTCSEDGTCTCGAGCNCAGPSHGSQGTCPGCGMTGYHGSSGHKMTAHSGTMQSDTDPGLGHEQHQLAVLLPPSSDAYAGMLTYSASENVQHYLDSRW